MMASASDSGVTPAGIGGCVACSALSMRNEQPHKASRPWDIHCDGFIMGEGAGILIMESMEHAMKRGARVYVEYLGGAATCDAHHITDPHPDGLGVASCMIKSLKDAGVAAEEVNYVNAHATSTRAGDLPELKAIKKVFNNTSELKINATKVKLTFIFTLRLLINNMVSTAFFVKPENTALKKNVIFTSKFRRYIHPAR
ncbi:3-oxoacyl-[acyl-carrier-protein] synthase I, chloroplastic-like [Salvia miltiorrhiza]|uniref:3-oxoacyl-[acyl-carrier-protein] synthase I, chloroplastic-like n=1 Tax=Salvia miltiorrhiza TaxID=226208 RepID=UPI0025ACD7DE|nr:3-oxoacyl-[acyl-carrier-protein] synthase I, chloroplastic-like [Salvia miltiorrhiza]